jgi:Thaumarchaeal output domain 1
MTSIVPLASGLAAAAVERRLGLLRRIAEAGGRVEPNPNPQSRYGFDYLALGEVTEHDLAYLAGRDYLEQRFFERVTLCPKCTGHHLNVREICPGCRRSNLTTEVLLHHFRCGYVGRQSEFASAEAGDGSRVCPKCNHALRHLGTEFDRMGRTQLCRECGLVSEAPPVEALCLDCATRTPAEDLVGIDFFAYVLTSLGHTAIRRGALLESEDEALFLASAPLYRPRVMREFVDQEVRRLGHFKGGFSMLVIERAPGWDEDGDDNGATQWLWLTRLRQCLRDVDLIGQLAEGIFVVLLPNTRLRGAEALQRRLLAQLGPEAPLTLKAIEITERGDLDAVLGRLGVLSTPQ